MGVNSGKKKNQETTTNKKFRSKLTQKSVFKGYFRECKCGRGEGVWCVGVYLCVS